MDHIRKADVMQAESLRMAWSMPAGRLGRHWACCSTHISALGAAPSFGTFAVTLLALFWHFRLSDNAQIRPGKTKAANPLKNIGRFLAQPRLRLAWMIAFGRSCFWTTFFVYGPILMVVTGQGELAGGLLVSAGNALLFTAIFWGRAGRHFGVRNTMALSFFALSGALLLAGLCGEKLPIWGGAFLLVGALFAVALDALGSTPFLRAVRAHERPQMTAVYRTYLDLSELLPPLVYSIVLAFAGLGVVFATLGIFTAICGLVVWRYLPKSM